MAQNETMIELTNYYHFPPGYFFTYPDQWAISAQLIERMEVRVSSWLAEYRWIPCQLRVHLAGRAPSLNGHEFPPSLDKFFNPLEKAISKLEIFEESRVAEAALIEKKVSLCVCLYSPENSEDEPSREPQEIPVSAVLFVIRYDNVIEIHIQSNETLSRRFRNLDKAKEEFKRLTNPCSRCST